VSNNLQRYPHNLLGYTSYPNISQPITIHFPVNPSHFPPVSTPHSIIQCFDHMYTHHLC
jgi:hypothetical protein